MRIRSIIYTILLVIVALIIITIVTLSFYRGTTSQLMPTTQNEKELVQKGEYLARLGDCTSCHTSDPQLPFAGGVPFEIPIGTIYAPNITPDPEYGIGNYSLRDFDNAVRHGIRKDGDTLYPAMPYPDYAVINDEDVEALYAYFMHGVQPLAIPNKSESIMWPLSMRWPLTAWRILYSPEVKAFNASKYPDATTARGAYLVQGLGHCGSCHTPRGWAMNEKAYDDTSLLYLSGSNAPIDGWMPINLRGDDLTGLGRIDQENLKMLLWSGRSDHNAVFGGMREVVDNSLQYATETDINAIAQYLKSLAPANPKNPPFVYDDATHKALASGNDSQRGAAIYLDSCAACHRTDGLGYDAVFPALAGNPAVQADNPISLIHIVSQGSTLQGTQHAVTTYVMPDELGIRLNAQDIADVLTFIRTSWGNQGKAVSLEEVQDALSQ